MDRRAELAEGALDYVLAHGLIGLSLRPLAAESGTSDRMLIYHFGSKERLISEILTLAQRRLAVSLAARLLASTTAVRSAGAQPPSG